MSILVKSLLFPELPYAFDALEPYIDAMTMEIHFTKHHKAYFDNLQKAVDGTELADKDFMEVIKHIGNAPAVVRNNGGGHYNHSLFWTIMGGKEKGEPTGKIAEAITSHFGSFENFKKEFSMAAATRFGSGWAWLSLDNEGKLFISSTPNQDNPLMDVAEKKGTPVLGLDVWEHAYYLKYQNRRPEYIENFFRVINWEQVNNNFESLL